MKLVDILARDLMVWPEHAAVAVANTLKNNLSARFVIGFSSSPEVKNYGDYSATEGGIFIYDARIETDHEVDDYSSAIVTRAQWQDAVDALKDGVATYNTENVRIDCNFASLTKTPDNTECKIIQRDWNGEGLPPVGTVCEVQDWVNGDTPSWRQTKVIAHHLGFAIETSSADGDDVEVGVCAAGDFRPIRTPEQIAAESEINELKEMLEMFLGGFEDSVLNIQSGLIALRNAGYKKFEIVDGE